MKVLGNIVALIGILIGIYAVVAKVLNPATEKAMSLGFMDVTALSGLVAAIAVMLVGLIIKSWHE